MQRSDDVGRTAAFGHPRRGGGDRDRGRFIIGDVDGSAAAGSGRGGGADQAQRLAREALQGGFHERVIGGRDDDVGRGAFPASGGEQGGRRRVVGRSEERRVGEDGGGQGRRAGAA